MFPENNCTCYDETTRKCPTHSAGYDQKIKYLKTELERLGFKVKVRKRQLAHIERTYFRIMGPADHKQFYNIAMVAVKEFFPGSWMTSGGFHGCSCDCTVALAG